MPDFPGDKMPFGSTESCIFEIHHTQISLGLLFANSNEDPIVGLGHPLQSLPLGFRRISYMRYC